MLVAKVISFDGTRNSGGGTRHGSGNRNGSSNRNGGGADDEPSTFSPVVFKGYLKKQHRL